MSDSDNSDISNENEVIIAQEQDALREFIHAGAPRKVEGTLILTNRRLIFACGDERGTHLTRSLKGESAERAVEDELGNVQLDWESLGGVVYYSEIEDLGKITENPENMFIPLSDVASVSGRREMLLEKPALKVSWRKSGSGEIGYVEFQENLTGEDRKKNLNDWAAVIEQLKDGKLKVQELPRAPPIDTLEGKIAYMMRDMQEKGPAEIEQQVEAVFKVELDSDDVEEACEKLVSMGYLDKVPDAAESFYRKRSPVGIDGLSS